MENVEKTLENWALVNRDPYLAPELATFSLVGGVYGDPTREPGKRIITSMVVGKVGEYVKTFSGSFYKLGAVDPEYEKLFPNAKQRLFDILPEDSVIK